jgi:nucleoside triphosphatase
MAQLFPEATVGGLVVSGKGEILLVRSWKWNDKFTVPGGHIELGERAEDAVKREVKEETGLELDSVELLLVQQAIYPEDYCKHEHFVFLDYICRAKEDAEVRLDNRELQSYVWVNPEDALNLDMEEFTRAFVVKFISFKDGEYKPNYS